MRDSIVYRRFRDTALRGITPAGLDSASRLQNFTRLLVALIPKNLTERESQSGCVSPHASADVSNRFHIFERT